MTPVREARPSDLSTLSAIQLTTLAEPWPELLRLGVDGPPLVLVYADPDPCGYALAVWDASSTAERSGPTDAEENGLTDAEENGLTDAVANRLDRRDAYLVELAVARPRQGEGVGSALLSKLADRLRREGVDRVRVTARADDGRVVEFYRERGFTLEATLHDHYESGDGLVLGRDLGFEDSDRR